MTDHDIIQVWLKHQSTHYPLRPAVLSTSELAISRAIIAQARAELIAEAAKQCEGVAHQYHLAGASIALECADAIRALIPDTKE